ncbi:hypothetical protein DSAG12_02857 [Promethearchaeum syntrophicum]|uniref:Uncharacterized protein n=1 Tax=Promethearchaeum syntrophicum TaxID=2594042 RepID=A0A5B9DDF4_9ARCH|nr:hypothetical protein [Candidatus Prometheoarchaeum syntrophicum]QEE17025.1 hypothetical protein DSAG12_02857 [Candidatus Prometheoarchaeum syntrophicum]
MSNIEIPLVPLLKILIMEIFINYKSELDKNIIDQITFIKEEFIHLFSQKSTYSNADHKLALDLLNQLSKLVQSPTCLDFLAETLENLEESFPTLF